MNDRERAVMLLRRVWDYIASDALELTEDGNMEADEVREICLDASRPETIGGDAIAGRWLLHEIPAKERDAIAREAFPDGTLYGY